MSKRYLRGDNRNGKYGILKPLKDDDSTIVCTWKENVVNRFIDNTTNTRYVKQVKDLITGEILKPDPFVFDINDSTNVQYPKNITFVNLPKEISCDEVKEILLRIKNDSKKLNDYLLFIEKLKEYAAQKYQGTHK